jgi:hypothetical protein
MRAARGLALHEVEEVRVQVGKEKKMKAKTANSRQQNIPADGECSSEKDIFTAIGTASAKGANTSSDKISALRGKARG